MSRTVRLGAFIVGTLALLAIGIFIVGSKKYLFTSTYVLKTTFADVAGLQAGADVDVGGVQSGTVKSIELPNDPGGKVTVAIQMDRHTHSIIKQDSTASIQTEGLLGNQFISVSFGTAGKPDVKDGDYIASVPPLELGAILNKADALMDQGKVAMTNVTQITEHLNSVTAKVDHGNGTVGALINDRSLYDNLNQTSSNLNQTSVSAKTTVVAAQAGITDFQENMEALKHNFLLKGYFKDRGYEDSSELGKDEIESVPQASTVKEFTLQAKDLFDKQDTAKLKGQKRLKEAGEFLAGNEFGVAVIQVDTGSGGDAAKDKTLAEGRALVLRNYLVQHYGFDDSKLKTVSIGKQTGSQSKDNWGLVRILVYPEGTPIPADKKPDTTPAADNKESAPSPSN
jgi:phospholipid/cholesterol/gamma-HCH transport system substrate-binding protein